MPVPELIDWDDAFENGAYIDGASEYPEIWAKKAGIFRARANAKLDISYGDTPREVLDLFLPQDRVRGLVVFVHGGYWLKFDKSSWSHLAAGAVAQGWAVAMPSYTLAPAARLAQMTVQVAQAIAFAAARVPGPIHLTGHSAGGHLVSRMVCADVDLRVRDRVAHVVSISGLHDLRPLLATRMNDDLGLTAETALAASAALQAPVQGIPVTAWVGGHERPEFLRQSAMLRECWARAGGDARLVVDSHRHHFDVIAGLEQPDSALTKALLHP